jgi:uncharacterized protein involved in exopolysaccharide biosynthesis
MPRTDLTDAAPPAPAAGALFAPAAAAAPQDLPGMLRRQALLVLACVLVTSVLALLFLRAQRPVYTSTSRVWVQTEQQGTPSFLSGITAYRESPVQDSVNRKIETEMELLASRTSVAEVIARLHIQPGQLARSPMAQVRSQIASWWGSGASKLSDEGRTNQLIDLFLDGLSVAPKRSKTADTSSNVLEIQLVTADVALAPRALSALLENYLRMGTLQNRRLGEATSRLIETKIKQARDDLNQVESRMVEVAVGGRANLVGDDVVLSAPRATPKVGGGVLRLDLGGEAEGNPQQQALSALKLQTQELQARLEETRQLYTDDADNVRVLRQRLAQSRQRLAKGVREGVRVDAQLARLERERALAQDRYLELQKKFDQIDLYLKLTPTEADSRVVLDPPNQPGVDEGQQRGKLALLAPLAGLLLGLLLAGLREMLDRRVHGPVELARLPGLSLLGEIPQLDARRRGLQAGLTP